MRTRIGGMVALTTAALTLLGAGMPLPVAVQAVVFRKIVGYDQALSAKKAEEIAVCVAYKADRAVAEELATALRTAGLKAAALELGTVGKHLAKVDVLYVMSAAEAAELAPVHAAAAVLTISGDPALATSGAVAVALDATAEGKPKIIVNFKTLQGKRHMLSAELLGLATVIR